jgi:hypothetical protein
MEVRDDLCNWKMKFMAFTGNPEEYDDELLYTETYYTERERFIT